METSYFENRSTVRFFSPEKISKNKIISILEKAMRAPTCGNMQLYSVIITREEENKKRLAEYHYNQPAAKTADIVLTVCADFNKFTRWCELSSCKPGYNNFHSFMMAATDAIIYAQQIVTIAENEGLGSCYLGTVNYNAKEISELLKLPDLVIPVTSLALGVPQKVEQQVERMSKESIIFDETYPELKDSEILNFFKPKEEFELNKNYVKENNKKNLAELFTDIRYPESVNVQVSNSFIDLLRQKGFLN